ncbi:alpha/beta hydrolase [Methylocaldum sp.]|uniref:alpha/beta fold hydrolase n=1 Tax=Methylocaldum sp. TaxID=1969727 RepID=UPI002D4D9AC1|nr:alpha/beta hydrolase [Methylocaldum sp.]HYE34056.1 alpha/beta hydrolase [Methylocaldum sp.]
MERVNLNGVDLEYDVQGAGEPLLLIHGSIFADAFFPLLVEPRIANNYRVISYHRRGFAGSTHAGDPFTIEQQAADGRALLRHLGIPRAHIAGHSYGAAIALQWALDAPAEVQSLALLEPPLVASAPSGPTFWEEIASVRAMYERGDKAGATDAFCAGVAGPEYRQVIDTVLPSGAFELAVTDLDTFFQVELPALHQWRFTAEEATRIRQPVLSVVGSETEPVFRESHALIQQWMPHAEILVVPQATHALQMMNASGVADGLARFFTLHKL